jgi:hypothetical protein
MIGEVSRILQGKAQRNPMNDHDFDLCGDFGKRGLT